MLTRASVAFILIAAGGCATQDSQSDNAQPSATDIALQAERDRQASIQSDIHVREQSRDLIFTSLNGHHQRIQSLRGESSDLSNQLTSLNNDVAAYLMNHKTAVICMGAAGKALSDDNEYSQDVKDLINGAAILCTLGLLSSDFRSEIANVMNELTQADTQAKNLQSQIQTLNDQITQETNGSVADQARYDGITSEIQQLQLRLPQQAPPP